MTVTVNVSKKHRLLVLPESEALSGLFPDAVSFTHASNKYLGIKHSAAETFLLRHLGYAAPSPISTYYDWEGGTPFDIQIKTCDLLTLNRRAYVLSGMGTGKTKSALWAWRYLNRQGLAKKLLVVAPLSTLKFTWAREVFATLPGVKCAVLHGTRKKRLELLRSDADVFIINHDGLQIIKDEVIADKKIDTFCLDELAAFRNGKSERCKNAAQIAAHMEWVWGMTGTPTPNEPTDVWGQARIVTPNAVPRYFNRFRENLMNKVSVFKWVPKADAIDRAFAVLQPSVRFTLDDVVELPELVYDTKQVEMSDKQKLVYDKLRQHAHAQLAQHEITAANAGAVMMKLLQISCGWVYVKDGAYIDLEPDFRVQILLDTLEAIPNQEKVIVFVNFKHALAELSKRLLAEGVDCVAVSGDTPMSERSDIFAKFQNTDKCRVLLAHPQCLAHGLTLTAASTIVWFNPTTSLEIYEQANARITRVGQKRKQLVLHLASSVVERRIYKLLQDKQQIQNKLLELIEEATKGEF